MSSPLPVSPPPVSTAAPTRPFLHLIVLGSFLIPLACIPYIPIRRHLLALRHSIQSLSVDTRTLHQELSTTILHARLRKEETLKLTEQYRSLQAQLDAATERTAQAESAALYAEKALTARLDAATERTVQAEGARLRAEEALKKQVDSLRSEKLPPQILADVSTSLADVASFIEEVEIHGLSHSIPRDRGIDRMRQLALKLHAIAKAKPINDTY